MNYTKKLEIAKTKYNNTLDTLDKCKKALDIAYKAINSLENRQEDLEELEQNLYVEIEELEAAYKLERSKRPLEDTRGNMSVTNRINGTFWVDEYNDTVCAKYKGKIHKFDYNNGEYAYKQARKFASTGIVLPEPPKEKETPETIDRLKKILEDEGYKVSTK